MKLLRTVALDPSDTFVFDPAAEPGEWAVSGAFRFWGDDPAVLQGKARSAFRSGFLGLKSWGWSTLVEIVEATDSDRAAVVELLAQQLVDRLGAPDVATARQAAEEEVGFAESLCNEATGILIERFGLSADQAFAVMRRVSQNHNVKLHTLAEHLVETGELLDWPGQREAEPPAG